MSLVDFKVNWFCIEILIFNPQLATYIAHHLRRKQPARRPDSHSTNHIAMLHHPASQQLRTDTSSLCNF